MNTMISARYSTLLLTAVAAFGTACTSSDAAEAVDTAPAAEAAVAEPAPSLDAIRAATERYRDVNVAIAEGYVLPMDLCDTAEMMGRPAAEGAMGIHYARMDLLGVTSPPNPRVNGTGTHTDFLRPSILIYEPQADGSLELVAIENLVFIDAWEAAGNRERPTFGDQAYNLMADDPATEIDEAHGFEPHYDLHMWLYRENPQGMFAQFNPSVSCQHQPITVAHGH